VSLVKAVTRGLNKTGRLPRYFNAEEVRNILEAVKHNRELHLLIHFLWKTGVRASEALQVKLGDIDPYNKTLRVVTLKKRGAQKTKHERIIPTPGDLLAEVLAWAHEKMLGYDDRLFPFTRVPLLDSIFTYIVVGFDRVSGSVVDHVPESCTKFPSLLYTFIVAVELPIT